MPAEAPGIVTHHVTGRDNLVRTISGSSDPDYGRFVVSDSHDYVTVLRCVYVEDGRVSWELLWNTPGLTEVARGTVYAETLAIACDYARTLNAKEIIRALTVAETPNQKETAQ